jgi:hypothetical protein
LTVHAVAAITDNYLDFAITDGGAWDTLYGTGFGASQGSGTVYVLPDEAIEYGTWTDTKIAFKVPGHAAGDADIEVVNGDGNKDTLTAGIRYQSAIEIAVTGPRDTTVAEPETGYFVVAIAAGNDSVFQWQDSTAAHTWANIAGADEAEYETPATDYTWTGRKYRCIATNQVSADTSAAAELTVTGAARVLTEPADVRIKTGKTATFAVIAGGYPAPTYAWQDSTAEDEDWVPLAEETNATLTTGATDTSWTGNLYRCIVTNEHGADTTRTALLTVTDNNAVEEGVYRVKTFLRKAFRRGAYR